MAGLDAGAMDRRIRIERAAVTISGRGTQQKAWAELVTVWAQRMPQRATEAWKASGTAAELETAWRIRWSSGVADVSPRDRIVFDGQEMAILGVAEIGRREGLEIVCKSAGAT